MMSLITLGQEENGLILHCQPLYHIEMFQPKVCMMLYKFDFDEMATMTTATISPTRTKTCVSPSSGS